MTTTARFDSKDPGELRVLTFDFTADLNVAGGEQLSGTPTVSITVVSGTDASPSSVLAGGNSFDPAKLLYYVPVKAGIDKVDYDIVVAAATTTAAKTLTLGGILPVRAQ
jgi:hypothetical protein